MVTRRGLLGGLTAVTVTAIAGCQSLSGAREVRSEFVYSAEIIPTSTITGVTIYIPIPIDDGTVVIEDRINDYAFEPDEWSVDLADTEHGPMLEVTVAEIRAQNRTYDMWIDWAVSEAIDTRKAFDNAVTLQPKSGSRQVECDFPHPDEWNDRLRCYSYEGRFYGEYEPTGTEVAVSASLSGDNAWYNGGWTANSYQDNVHGFVDGTGWATGPGSFREGIGSY